jgi:hypothetical protein
MAPFRSSSFFGSHLNPITTSTSGGIAQTMSLVFILRIILRIILIVRRSAVGRKVFLWKTPDSGSKIGGQAKRDRVPASTESCRSSTLPSFTFVSIVSIGAIGVALFVGSSQNQESRIRTNDFEMHPTFPEKFSNHYSAVFQPSYLEFTKCALDKESLSYSSLAHSTSSSSFFELETRKGPQCSRPPVRHSATIFQISFRMKYYIYEITQCATQLISEIKPAMNHIWNLQPNAQYSSSPPSRKSGTVTPFQVILQLLITAKNEQEEKKLTPRRNSDIGSPIGSANTNFVDDKPIGNINNGHRQSIRFVDGNTSLLPSRNSGTDAPTGFIFIQSPFRVAKLHIMREAKSIQSVSLLYFSTENEGDVLYHRQ